MKTQLKRASGARKPMLGIISPAARIRMTLAMLVPVRSACIAVGASVAHKAFTQTARLNAGTQCALAGCASPSSEHLPAARPPGRRPHACAQTASR